MMADTSSNTHNKHNNRDADVCRSEEYPVFFAAKNRDKNIRQQSSSGGMFYALASYIISECDGVVYGCAFNNSLEALHIRCETLEEVKHCLGSKYSQSDMGETILKVRDDLKANRTVLFTGTPCQVDAVRFACKNIANKSLLLIDIVCHGVPSPAAFQEWLRTLEEVKGSTVVRYEHRPKSMGWGHFERITFFDGSSEQGTRWSEVWKRYYYDNRSLRPSCYRCPYTTVSSRPGDISIADFWGIEKTHLASFYDPFGVSLVLANTGKGMRALSKLDVDYEAASLADALPRNPMLAHPSVYEGKLSEVWEGIYRDGMLATMRRERFLASPVRFMVSRVKRFVKKTLGKD